VLPPTIEAAIADARNGFDVGSYPPSVDVAPVADATLSWVAEQKKAEDYSPRLIVDDHDVRPWVRAIVRKRHADLPVLAREEVA
jgi:flagellar biosynthesis component FlhA